MQQWKNYNKYECTVDQVREDLPERIFAANYCLREMTSRYEVKSKIWHRQSMRIHSMDIPAQFHPRRIWNDTALSFFGSGHPNKNKQKQQEEAEKQDE